MGKAKFLFWKKNSIKTEQPKKRRKVKKIQKTATPVLSPTAPFLRTYKIWKKATVYNIASTLHFISNLFLNFSPSETKKLVLLLRFHSNLELQTFSATVERRKLAILWDCFDFSLWSFVSEYRRSFPQVLLNLLCYGLQLLRILRVSVVFVLQHPSFRTFLHTLKSKNSVLVWILCF